MQYSSHQQMVAGNWFCLLVALLCDRAHAYADVATPLETTPKVQGKDAMDRFNLVTFAQLVDTVDADHDGLLTLAELTEYMATHRSQYHAAEHKQVIQTYWEHIQRDVAYLDRNNDSMVSMEELKPETRETIKFADLDLNNDSLLSAQELMRAMMFDVNDLVAREAQELLDAVDKSGDGAISHAEATKQHEEMFRKLTRKHDEF
jgi:Ca2+-binding EF-hand superfamily protein